MDADQKARYEHFRKLLEHNRAALNALADLEQLYYSNRPFTLQHVERKIGGLLRYDRAADWNEVRAMLFARYRFD